MTYPIPKPTYPTTIKVLGLAVLLGLAGLGLVAYEVFRLIDNPLVAAAFALVIELGAISEALSIIKRNRPAVAGLLISLLVSGFYNYTRASQASAGLAVELSQLELVALALGPLSATLFLALSLGHALKEHETSITAWEQAAATWEAEQVQAAAEAEARRAEREAARALELKALELEHQARAQAAELANALKIERARIRLEAQGRSSTPAPRTSRKEPGSVVEVPRGSYSDFVEVIRANGREWKNAELAEKFHVSTRTISTWRAQYAAETEGAPAVTSN